MKTFSAKPHEVQRDWFIVDATDKVLGRVASEVARRLRGKHKPEYTPHVDTGDFIVIVNVEKLRVTGNKAKTKSTTVTRATRAVSTKLRLARCNSVSQSALWKKPLKACCRRVRWATPC